MMQFEIFTSPLMLAIELFAMAILLILIIKMGYKKFKTDVYVIHFRRGRIKYVGLGGSFFLIPFLDNYVAISSRLVKTTLKLDDAKLGDGKTVKIDSFLIWQVKDPKKYYYKLLGGSPKFINKDPLPIVKKHMEEVLRKTLLTANYEEILRYQRRFIMRIQNNLGMVLEKYGIGISRFGIPKFSVVKKS